MRLEINFLNGKFFERMRIWLQDGTLVQETYYIGNMVIIRAAYLKAALKYPDWPDTKENQREKWRVTIEP